MGNESQAPSAVLSDRNGTPPAPQPSVQDAWIGSPRSVTTLVYGIIDDVRQLIWQQLAMFRQEVQDELRRVRQGALALAAGFGITAVSGGMLLLMLPLLLNWLAPELPLWACFGIVGVVLAAAGGILVFVGTSRIRSCHPLSNQAVEALKENLTWPASPK